MQVSAIIVAGGLGTRAGPGPPKQLRRLLGRPVVAWSLDALRAHPAIESVVLVTPPGDAAAFEGLGAARVVEGGDTRTASVKAGLVALQDTATTHVLIHDAARPGLTATIINALVDALAEHDAAAPAISVVDALKRRDGEAVSTVPRGGLYRVQTPQAFDYGLILKALSEAPETLVDDLEAVERLGTPVHFVPGLERLIKLTYPEDFALAEHLLAPLFPCPRIGTGFDVHAFGPGDHVTLCGVRIPHGQGLVGHSDADAAWHALTDAILGALGLGDIGDHFPPSDPQWKGAPSSLFLARAVELAGERGYSPSNCDITLICETPKIKPHRQAMREKTAERLGCALEAVSVKATTAEGLGFTGRGEGIAAQAVAVLSPRSMND